VPFEGKTVVVTGAGGFIGSHLVERLVSDGARVRAMLRYTSRGQRGCLDLVPESTLGNVEITLGDVRDFDAVREIVRGADAIFHLAALIGIPYSYEHPQEVIDTNIIGTSNVLVAAKELGSLERIVLTSTSEVYGSAIRVPMDGSIRCRRSPRTPRRRSPRTRWGSAFTGRSGCRSRSCGRSMRTGPGSRRAPSSRRSSARRSAKARSSSAPSIPPATSRSSRIQRPALWPSALRAMRSARS
jgi:NAD(P)-dependent dehydrogenase (short-subunit alcohol dehydrogenase family)